MGSKALETPLWVLEAPLWVLETPLWVLEALPSAQQEASELGARMKAASPRHSSREFSWDGPSVLHQGGQLP